MSAQLPFDGVVDESPKAGADSIYDPLRRENLGRSVLWALTSGEPIRMDRVRSFNGCGIYAIYYAGDHELYAPISGSFEVPIYVGKSNPEGGRKGVEVAEAWAGTPLWKGLSTHRRKLKAAADFELEDFYVRYLPADDLFTPMAERLMIQDLQPVWNVILEGFGVTPQGGPCQAEPMRPKWHEVHTGVPWAEGMRPQPSGPEALREAIREHLKLHAAPPASAAGRPPGVI